ncbi:MAG: hypothetical protein HN370_00920 [Phycisphaerales bacterium]|nr:hypothetical protein [Phycisphaerales bacterium]
MTSTQDKPTRGILDILFLLVMLGVMLSGIIGAAYPYVSDFDKSIGLSFLPSPAHLHQILTRVSFYMHTTQELLLTLVIFAAVHRGMLQRVLASAPTAAKFGSFFWLAYLINRPPASPTERWVFLGVCVAASMVKLLFIMSHYAPRAWVEVTWGIGAAGAMISEFTYLIKEIIIPNNNLDMQNWFRHFYAELQTFERVFFALMLVSIIAMLIHTWNCTTIKPKRTRSTIKQ